LHTGVFSEWCPLFKDPVSITNVFFFSPPPALIFLLPLRKLHPPPALMNPFKVNFSCPPHHIFPLSSFSASSPSPFFSQSPLPSVRLAPLRCMTNGNVAFRFFHYCDDFFSVFSCRPPLDVVGTISSFPGPSVPAFFSLWLIGFPKPPSTVLSDSLPPVCSSCLIWW